MERSPVVPALLVYTPDDLALALHVPRKTIVALCRTGKLPGARKIGRGWRIPQAAAASFFDADLPGTQAARVAGDGGREGEASRRSVSRDEDRGERARGTNARRARGPRPAVAADRAAFLRSCRWLLRPREGEPRRRHMAQGARVPSRHSARFLRSLPANGSVDGARRRLQG